MSGCWGEERWGQHGVGVGRKESKKCKMIGCEDEGVKSVIKVREEIPKVN